MKSQIQIMITTHKITDSEVQKLHNTHWILIIIIFSSGSTTDNQWHRQD